MPAIFGDHMILQQGAPLSIWGWCAPGEKVRVTLGSKMARTTGKRNGRWKINFEPFAAQNEPLQMTVSGRNEVVFKDILIGDVWLCSGQSNMEWPLESAHNAETEIPEASDLQLRLFIVERKSALTPQCDVSGKWEICTPQSAARFSAVAYFFARELRRTHRRPIGLIGAYWGRSKAQAWISPRGLKKHPPFKKYIAERNAAARRPTSRPVEDKGIPGNLYNGMIAPLVSQAIRGAIWYQGESNSDNANDYSTLFKRLIESWRESWGRGDFPFLFVQLANYGRRLPGPVDVDETWAELREAQAKALAIPNTGMVTAIDIGDGADIHPGNKADVGFRLARLARKMVYGEDIVASGPVFESLKIEKNVGSPGTELEFAL